MRRNIVDGLAEDLVRSKPLSVLSFPVPECTCWRGDPRRALTNASSTLSPLRKVLKSMHRCPPSMDNELPLLRNGESEQDDTDDDGDDDSPGTAPLFRTSSNGATEMGSKEESQALEDQEELEAGEK